jgi:23S rRNA (pseudouridine1915-N3)-methyltransferase
MKITLAAIGRERDAAARGLFDRYAERLPWPLTLRELEAKKAKDGPARMAEEAALLAAALPAGAPFIALDERGRDMASRDFAARIGRFADEGVAQLGFVIGGADGLLPDLRQRAALVLGFGKLTWPHLLVRVMLAEQLYRAHTILTGHPYHRD